MKTYVIEDLSDDDLLSLLISEAHKCSVPSESNLLSDIRGAIKARLTKRAVDGSQAVHKESCPCNLDIACEKCGDLAKYPVCKCGNPIPRPPNL